MLFGWGTKQKSTPSTVENMALISTWRYVRFFFVFQYAYGQKFTLMGNDRSQDQEIDKLRALEVIHSPLPAPSLWQKWSLPGLFLVLLISVVIAVALGTDSGDLDQKCSDTNKPAYSTNQCINYRFDQKVRSIKQGNN